MPTPLTFRPADGPLGAFVEGWRPTDDAPAPVDELTAGLIAHRVLIFRGSPIPADRFVALGEAFGQLEVLPEPEKRHPDHPEIFNLSNVRPDGSLVTFDEPQSVFLRGTERWHTDSSFRTIPCLCTMLNAIEVPERGGETEFVDTTALFRSLPPDRQAELHDLRVIHSYRYSRANNPGRMEPMTPEEEAKYPPVTHPLVRNLPSGEPGLFMGGHASHIEGMDEQAGRDLLAGLIELIDEHDVVLRHRWQPGDLVVWDNRSTLHRLRPYDIAAERRIMQRLTVAGTEPVARHEPG
jgi:alpha-ketoglutarate-dependent taurine dioxygenase